MDPGGCASSPSSAHIQLPLPSIPNSVDPAPLYLGGLGAPVHASGSGISQAQFYLSYGHSFSLTGTCTAGRVCYERLEGPRNSSESPGSWP